MTRGGGDVSNRDRVYFTFSKRIFLNLIFHFISLVD